MKISKTILSGLTLLLLALLSCSKKNENKVSGPPKILRVTTSLNHNNNITRGDLNQWVIIIGSNLSNTQKVSFNDIDVSYADIFSSDTLVSIQIPRKIPVKVSNTITLTTNLGTTTFNFTISTPPFKFTGIRNEFSLESDTMEINGENFDLYFEKESTIVTFTGGKTAKLTDMTPSALKLVVPVGAEPGPLNVKGGLPLNSEFNTGQVWYKDNRNPVISSLLVPAALTASNPDFPDNPGPMVIKSGTYVAWTWDTFFSCYSNYPIEAERKPEDYLLKFEMNTKVPIAAGDIIITFGGGTNYWRWPYNYYGTIMNTNNKWVTVSLPLNPIMITPTAHNYFQFILSDGSERMLNFATCNWRVVPKN